MPRTRIYIKLLLCAATVGARERARGGRRKCTFERIRQQNVETRMERTQLCTECAHYFIGLHFIGIHFLALPAPSFALVKSNRVILFSCRSLAALRKCRRRRSDRAETEEEMGNAGSSGPRLSVCNLFICSKLNAQARAAAVDFQFVRFSIRLYLNQLANCWHDERNCAEEANKQAKQTLGGETKRPSPQRTRRSSVLTPSPAYSTSAAICLFIFCRKFFFVYLFSN